MAENEEAIRKGHERMQELDSEHPCSDERLDAVLGEYQKNEGLTYELAHALIDAIYSFSHHRISLIFLKFGKSLLHIRALKKSSGQSMQETIHLLKSSHCSLNSIPDGV